MSSKNDGWTSANLLKEGESLIKLYNETDDPDEKSRIDGCFLAIQEVLLAAQGAKKT